jgi:D-alanine-D-alanine ligase
MGEWWTALQGCRNRDNWELSVRYEPYLPAQNELRTLERALVDRARDLALFLVYDRPELVDERPGLVRASFAQRAVSDDQLEQTLEAFRGVGAYVEMFGGERPFLEALASGRLQSIRRSLKVAYNGIESGVTPGGFQPGRKALVPSVADAYGLVCAHSDAYACAFTLHKFHCFTFLRALGIRTPRVWHFRLSNGWAGGRAPGPRTKVICKSTYEAWSVGVDEDSVFAVDESLDARVSRIAAEIGQPVTVQEFVAGLEVCVPVYACPGRIVTPPVEVVLAKAPGDPDAVMTLPDNIDPTAVTYRAYDGPAGVVSQLRDAALEAFDVLQLQSFARVDFRVDADGEPWIIDVANTPGMGAASSAYSSLALLGFDHPSFLRAVIAATLGARGLLPGSSSTTPLRAS